MEAPSAQVRLDAGRVVQRVRTALSFQVATALQTALDAWMAPGEQLAALVLLCLCVRAMAGFTEAEIAHEVLVVQVGQTLQGMLAYKEWATSSTSGLALGFLLNTLGLCLPSVLELVSPAFVASSYVQNALSVWLFQYASSTRQVLQRVDFGVSVAFVCVLAFVLSLQARKLVARLQAYALYKYVARAGHMLRVDALLGVITGSELGAVPGLRIALLAVVVLAADSLDSEGMGLMQDVRGYIVYRIAGELQGLGVLSSDGTTVLAAALLAFCAHTGLGALQLRSGLASSAAEVCFVASANVLVASATSGEAGARRAEVRMKKSRGSSATISTTSTTSTSIMSTCQNAKCCLGVFKNAQAWLPEARLQARQRLRTAAASTSSRPATKVASSRRSARRRRRSTAGLSPRTRSPPPAGARSRAGRAGRAGRATCTTCCGTSSSSKASSRSRRNSCWKPPSAWRSSARARARACRARWTPS
jgi:hypothetical protein